MVTEPLKRNAVITVIAVAALAAGCSNGSGTGETAARGGTPAKAANEWTPPKDQVAEARTKLRSLRTKEQGNHSGYSRSKFGVRWKDTDHDGCDQRNDVLARDLTNIKRDGKCKVLSGRLKDPYSGRTIEFTKAKASEVQIDHVYPLALAWRMGASGWPASRRQEFANDLSNLLAVWGPPNREKSDKGPSEWKPQQAYQCAYGVKYVMVADKYVLPVTKADHDALEGFLGRC
ncbi:HNH endonuclease family protein [Actinomadura atramentaria]|uniref:HNH endonuclease family protein n=1 Tax=Actinomadura atramentaria TaxID=1990 RepID=UPI0003811F68|nr:HNH endonuclease family protein [Actinomadura atramentaria]